MSTATKTKARPVQEIRLGRVRAAIWENQTENGVRHNVTINRLYKDGDEWKDSTSFGRDDLPLVAKVSDWAHSWIFKQQTSSKSNDTETVNTGMPDDIPF